MVNVFHSMDFSTILSKIDTTRLGQKVGIKLHFGEEGCTTFLSPDFARMLCDKLRELRKEPTLIECNTLYVGERSRASNHKKLAKKHGFDFAPIHILDGELGNEFTALDGCKVGKGLMDYDSLIVLTHFKGHLCGFGGAVKNLGMGLGSRAGKMDMHSSVHPIVQTDGCNGCATCVENCNEGAITLEGGRAKINPDMCVGCAMCISVCPQNTIKIPWQGRTTEGLHDRMRDYAGAIINRIGKDKMTFISVMESMTAECDCMPYPQEIIIENKGHLISTDIDAIDLAGLKITNNLNGQVKFNKQNRKAKFNIVEI
ncbi:MAG: DUF362 domain-containing protein [Candidatus Altiarchaeota archaeon]|nr:DUF362 domain-containing protein [Candidatus Altiarchaeota archaeon]